MEKTRKCYHYFICLSILLGILFVIVFLRLQSGFEFPSQDDLYNFLLDCKFPLLVGFVLSTSITIALKSIIDDLYVSLARLTLDLEDLNEKMKGK